MVPETPLRKMPSKRQERNGRRLFPVLAEFRDRKIRSKRKGTLVTLAEFERRITDAAEALSICSQEIKENDSFAVETSLLQAFKDLEGCKDFAARWADEQEAEIAKAEEARGYEVVKEGD